MGVNLLTPDGGLGVSLLTLDGVWVSIKLKGQNPGRKALPEIASQKQRSSVVFRPSPEVIGIETDSVLLSGVCFPRLK